VFAHVTNLVTVTLIYEQKRIVLCDASFHCLFNKTESSSGGF